MKIKSIIFALIVLAATVSCQQNGSSGDVTLTNEKDSVSYAIGIQLGKSVKSQKFDVNVEIIKKAFEVGYAEEEGLIPLAETQAIIQAAQKSTMERLATDNITKGETFLAENKTKEGVVTTESGLQYKVITKGTGPVPKSTDKIKAHYKGTLIDGTTFDSSYDRGEPAVFPVTGVIKGWIEALQLMPVGSKWELYIPSEIAYGPRGSRSIGPNEVLIFTLELISIEK